MQETSESNIKSRQETYGLFLLGLAGGILGGMVSGVMDRNFSHLGHAYDLVVIILFAICLEGLIWIFKKKLNGKF